MSFLHSFFCQYKQSLELLREGQVSLSSQNAHRDQVLQGQDRKLSPINTNHKHKAKFGFYGKEEQECLENLASKAQIHRVCLRLRTIQNPSFDH